MCQNFKYFIMQPCFKPFNFTADLSDLFLSFHDCQFPSTSQFCITLSCHIKSTLMKSMFVVNCCSALLRNSSRKYGFLVEKNKKTPVAHSCHRLTTYE